MLINEPITKLLNFHCCLSYTLNKQALETVMIKSGHDFLASAVSRLTCLATILWARVLILGSQPAVHPPIHPLSVCLIEMGTWRNLEAVGAQLSHLPSVLR